MFPHGVTIVCPQTFQAGDYPLHIAVRHCHLNVARELLEYIANRRSKVDAYMLVNGPNSVHFMNMSMQYTVIFMAVSISAYNFDIFIVLLKHDCGYSLESPQRRLQSMKNNLPR